MNHKSFIVKTIVLLLTALVITGCGGAESRKAKYLAKGKAYIEEKNYDKAKIEIKNALQIDPKHAEGYYLMGIVEEARQNWPQAFGNFGKAVELDPAHLDAKSRFGRLQLMAGKPDEAVKLADAILASDPKHFGGRTLKAAIMARKDDDAGAIRETSSVISEAPGNVEAVGLLASIYMKIKKPDMAIETLQKSIEANPDNIPLRMQLVNVYGTDRKYLDKIEPVIQKIISLDPENLSYRRSLALFYTQTEQMDKAEKALRDTVQLKPDDADRYLLLAEFLATRKSVAAAETELQAAIKEYPESYQLYFGLVRIYETIEAYDKIAQVYRDVIESDGTGKDGLHARNKLAELLLLKLGKRSEAEKLTEEVLKENPKNNDALINRARLALSKADPETAITALREVMRDQPGSVIASGLLASAHMQKKEPQLAREALVKAVETNPGNVQARLAYAQFMAQNKDTDGALKIMAEALKAAPDNLDVLLARMELLAAKQDMKGAQSAIAAIKEKHPGLPVGYYHMGRYHASQKRYDEAVREFELALGKSGAKDSFQVLSSIASVRIAQGKPDLALGRMQELLKTEQNHPFAHELMAEVYITKKQYDEAEKSLHAAIKNNPKWNVPYRNLANLYMVRGDTRAAAEIYQKGLEAIPDDAQLLFHIAEMYERTRDFDKAVVTYERMLTKDPESNLARNNLASLLTDQKSDAASLKRARELVLGFETQSQPAFRDTLGWVHHKSGETDKAIEILKEVVKQAPNVPIFRYHLGMAYHKQGNMAEAKVHLAKAVDVKDEYPGLVEARETLKKIQ